MTEELSEQQRAVPIGWRRPASVRLTPREVEVLERTWAGRTMKEIAVEMGLSERWIRNIRLRLGEKLHCSNVVQLVRAGLERGFIVL